MDSSKDKVQQEFKVLPNYKKWYLKYTDRAAYDQYKEDLRKSKIIPHEEFIVGTELIVHPELNQPARELSVMKHSGNSGDIIYALPAMYALAGEGKIHLLLHPNQPGVYSHYHPLGPVMLNEKMIEMLTPLLLYQDKIESVAVFENEELHYNLDLFREYSFSLTKGSISRWYFNVFAVFNDLSRPWLKAPKNDEMKDTILIARSHRYREPGISYNFLSKYENVAFVGVDEEYEDMKKAIPHLRHRKLNNFLELASLIQGCKLFIGNQSFPFSIAEGLKANRLLEAFYDCPNVVVEGKGAHDFYYQPQFEYLVAKLVGLE